MEKDKTGSNKEKRIPYISYEGKKIVYICNKKEILMGEAKKFFYPSEDTKGTRKPGLLIHLINGLFAYEGLCTHMKAELEWNPQTEKIWCTLHDGMYDPETGRPYLGMPKEPLAKVNLKIEENGDIYVIV